MRRMLFIGRVLLGIAVAMASVAVTLYNSEMAPAQHRGRLNQIFQVRGSSCILGLGGNHTTAANSSQILQSAAK